MLKLLVKIINNMKTVIEKIISSYFGKFINGIQGNLSVSIFDGNFQLENISLNQQYFDSLNTPFRLTYSSIGKLNLQASLSKLSSTPVECTLDNIYAVFEFRSDEGVPQQLSPEKQIMDKKQYIQKYIREMFDDYLKKLRDKDEKKQDGMMAKLGKKIIDNLQLKIINLHVRFEQNRGGQRYAWGVTLQQISFVTTDNEWKPTFIDRMAENGKSQKLLKKMNLKNLSVYWQSGLKQKNQAFIGQLKTNSQKANKMLSLIKDTRFSIISLTSQVKLIINQAENFQLPLYQLSVDLDPIIFELQRAQVSQMIDFTQKNISENQQILKNLTLKKKKSKKPYDAGQKQKLEETFYQFVQNVVDNHELAKDKQKKIQQYAQFEDIPILRTLLNKVDDEQLLMWALKPIRRKVKQARQRELKKKKKGWFGGQYQLTEEETKALSNFVQEVAEANDEQRPSDCIFFTLRVQIQGGKFAFINHKDLSEQEILEFQIGKIGLFLIKSQNDSLLDLATTVESISLNLFLPIYGSDQKLRMNILKNLKSEQEEQFFDPGQEQQKFISIKYSKKVEIKEEKPIIKTNILGQVKQIAITYKKVFMKKFKSFFTFKNFNESMKNETIKKWQQMKQKNEQKNVQTQEQTNEVVKMFNINFKITSPLFICPLTETGGWCVNLGQLSVESFGDSEKQIYPIKVQSAFFRYYPNLNICLKKMSEAQLEQNQIFCLVKDMNFLVTYTNYLYIKREETDIILPNFQVNFTQKQYKNLISLKDIFVSDDSQSNFFQSLKKDRQQIEKKKAYEGTIQKKSEDLDKWHSYFGILSGEFIYLYGSQKELKCLQKVPIKNSRLEFNKQTKIISLFSNEGVIQLAGSQFQNNFEIWRDRITSQMKQFMTIYEVVQEMMSKEEEVQIPRKRVPTGSSHLGSKRQKFMTFKIQRIGFNYKDEKNRDVMVFKLYGLLFQEHEQNKISNKSITIQKLESFDYIHKYTDPKLQSLISTQYLTIKFQRNKNDDQKKLQIQLAFKDIYINWKPDVLVILMKLVYNYILKQVKHRVDDGQQKTRQQLFNEVLNDPKFSFSMKQYERSSHGKQVKDKRLSFVQKNKRLKQLIKLNLSIKRTEVVMIHRQSHLTMFKLIADNIENEVVMGQNQKFVAGSIESMLLYEMTGYPRQNYTQNDKIVPYLIVKPKFTERTGPIVEYKWSSYEPFVLPNSERINSFIYILINPIECHYFQQITFRLIDYILIQIILLLSQPDMVVANENLLEQLKKTTIITQKQAKIQSQSIVKILFSKYEEVVKKIVDPYFMDMYFQLRNPTVLLKSEKTSNFYHKADFKDIVFKNEDIKNSKRFQNCECPDVKRYIYEEIYEILCNQCHFYSVEECLPEDLLNKRREELLFDTVDIKLIVNKLIMEDQINLIYPELNTYDRSFQTSTLMSKLVIKKLTRQEYLLINKLVNFNMIFDDNRDEHFIHNFKITKLLSPKPIYYELVIPQIQLTGNQGNFDSTYKLFTMKMDGFKMIYTRQADLNSSFQILLTEANLYGYEYIINALPKGEMNLMEEFQSEAIKPKRIDLMEFRAKKKDEYCTDITIKMKTSGEKIIEMNILSIQAFIKLHLMQLIFEWCLLQDAVFPTVSIYANDITFHLTIHHMSAWLKETLDVKSNQNPRAFKMLGVFCYKFHRKANFSQQHLEELMKDQQISFADVNKMPQTSYMTFLLNTQIYHCLASGNLRTKRQVVEKITFNMVQKSYYKVANEQLFKIKSMTHRKLNLDRGLFKFSFTDIFLMKDILAQISQDREYIGLIRQKTNPKKVEQKILNSNKALIPADTELSSLENMDLDIEALSFYLINNCREAFIPIVRVHLNNAIINKSNTIKKDLLKANFEITVFYFNSSIFRWEPMIEKVDLAMSKLAYTSEGQQNIFSSIETLKPILLNISKEMVIALRDTLEEWNKKDAVSIKSVSESQKQIEGYRKMDSSSSTGSPKKARSIHETIELVSQYVIRNQIGYPIEIYSHGDRKLMYRIENLSQIDYQYELQKYDDENQAQILIGIEILHHRFKFKRITHISLGLDINFSIVPEMVDKNQSQTMQSLPVKSIINITTQTKDSKRYLILKTSKWIEDYLNNTKQITYLPFDHPETIVLKQQPHQGKEVSLFKMNIVKDKEKSRKEVGYRYIAQEGVLKIMGRAMIYNYTPIPLLVNTFFVLPDQFVTIYTEPTIQNIKYQNCKGVKVDYDEKNQIYYIYCEGYIIDYAGLYYQLDYAKEFSFQFMKNGLKFVIYLLANAKERIKVRLDKKFKSVNGIKCSAQIKPAIGNQKFQLRNYSNSLCEYQTYGYLSSYTGNEYKDFKKIIEVAPFYVLSNTTNYRLKICQMESQDSFILEPGERVPFFWQNINKPKQIKIAALKTNTMWGYSGPLSIFRNTHSFVVRNTSNISDYRILSLQIENTNTINFVHIVDCHPKKGNNIMLCNHFEAATLRFYQMGIFNRDYEMQNPAQYTFIVKPGQQMPFGYEVPLQKHQIHMDIIFDTQNPKYCGLSPIQVMLEDIENNLFQKKIDIITKQNRKKSLLLRLSFEGNVKKLQLMHYSKSPNEIKKGQFVCKIPSVLISFIGYQEKVRKEVINIIMSGVELQSSKTNKVTEYIFTIRGFQVDSCLKISPMFPVILTSTGDGSFLQFMITKDNFNSKLINYIGVSINKFILSITSEEIQCLQENISDITQVFTSRKKGTSIENMREYQLFQQPSGQLNSSLYFVSAEIHPLKFNLTFKHVNNWGGALIKTFASIDNCNLSVAGKKISHFTSRNISEFFDHLRKHYQEGIRNIILPMIGNLAILGSPLSLAQRIASGFKDLIELPAEGFNNGALQGGKGIAKGAGSLAKNTFEGAFNTVQSVAGSVGNGISSLAFDEQFARERQKIKNDRSSHIGQGLANGAKSIVNGFAKGFTGLFTSPVEGAQESGIGGFFVGSLKGVAGLVAKPVSGIFDATTKTLEGIKNTPSYLENDKQKEQKFKRRRYPRVFYTYNKQFRSYDEDLSVSAKIIALKNEQKYSDLSWYSVYHLVAHESKEKKNPLLLMTFQYLILHNLADNSLIQVYRSEDIFDVIYQGTHNVKVSMYDTKKKRIGHISFSLKHPLATKLTNQIKSICKIYCPVYGFNYKIKDSLQEFLELKKAQKR